LEQSRRPAPDPRRTPIRKSRRGDLPVRGAAGPGGPPEGKTGDGLARTLRHPGTRKERGRLHGEPGGCQRPDRDVSRTRSFPNLRTSTPRSSDGKYQQRKGPPCHII